MNPYKKEILHGFFFTFLCYTNQKGLLAISNKIYNRVFLRVNGFMFDMSGTLDEKRFNQIVMLWRWS